MEDFLVEAADALFEHSGQSAVEGPRSQDLIRRAFVGMVQLGEGMADSRRVATLAELVSSGDDADYVRGTLAPFAAPEVRLITISEENGEPTYELTHEALITSWGRLRAWLGYLADRTEATRIRGDLRLNRRLFTAAVEWRAQRAGLWRPPELDLLSAYLQRVQPQLPAVSQDFADASLKAWASEIERQRKSQQRQRTFATAVAVLAVILGIALLLTIHYWRETVNASQQIINERNTAQRAVRRDLAQRLATQSDEFRQDSPVRSLLLSAESVAATRQDGLAIPAAREAVAKSLQAISGVGLGGHADTLVRATFSADDRFLATASRDGGIRVWGA